MNCALSVKERRALQFEQLMRHGLDHPNTRPLAELLASWQCGDGVLPEWLGLDTAAFDRLHQFHFGPLSSVRSSPWRGELDPRLDDLRDDLVKLLQLHARDDSEPVAWIAELIATACQGSNHLWEDLGVWNRASLSELIAWNFPDLFARNDRDMKWKKFLFKQLCDTEGIYICRAPTCDECRDFDDCFGPE